MVVINVTIVLSIIGIIGETLSAAAYTHWLTLYFRNYELVLANKNNEQNYWYGGNIRFSQEASIFLFAVLAYVFIISELGLIFKAQWFAWIQSRTVRSIIYILKGIPTLGICGDLGIAAGVIELITGAINLLYDIIVNKGNTQTEFQKYDGGATVVRTTTTTTTIES